MSNAGLDNWKRDYPVKERAILILQQLVASAPKVTPQGVNFEFPDIYWVAHAEAQKLIAEANANDP